MAMNAVAAAAFAAAAVVVDYNEDEDDVPEVHNYYYPCHGPAQT